MKKLIIGLSMALLLCGCSNRYTDTLNEVVSEAIDKSDVLDIADAAYKEAVTNTVDQLIKETTPVQESTLFDINDVAEYTGNPYIVVNDKPYFSEDEITTVSYENYSVLDSLNRPGVAIACVGTDIMPTEERGEIGMIKPAGWHTVKYPDLIEDVYLYNRCHIIGYQLTGENANEQNLLTGTRYFNTEGMLPFENEVSSYVHKTGNHVMYRVTPVYIGDELVCRGVLMEGYSVEDNGSGVCFCVYAYNVQPGIVIDYMTGDSHKAEDDVTENDYVLNEHTLKFHLPTCDAAESISEDNKVYFHGLRQQLIDMGYTACGGCNP